MPFGSPGAAGGAHRGRASRKTLWVEPGVPERFVHVDVPEAGQGPLVEQRGLQRGAAPLQPLAQSLAVKAATSGSSPRRRRGTARARPARAAARCRNAGHRGRRPRCRCRASAARAGEGRLRARRPAASRHAEVDQQRTPDANRTIRYLPRRSTCSTRSPVSSEATIKGSSGRVKRTSLISTCSSRRPSSAGAISQCRDGSSTLAGGMSLRSTAHPTTSSKIECSLGGSSPSS